MSSHDKDKDTTQQLVNEAWLDELAQAGEEPPTAEELAAAQQFASLTDSWLLQASPPDPAPDLEDSLDELASLGLLMRHAASPPALDQVSKQRIEEQLMALPQAEPQLSWLERFQQSLQGLFLRPVWTTFALALFFVGSWGVYQTIQPQRLNPTTSVYSQHVMPGQRLFGGTMSQPSKVNPFEHTKSASERLDAVTERLGQWQRKRWLHKTWRKSGSDES